MDEGRGHRRVNTPGKPADHPAGTDLRPDRRDLFLDEIGHRPRRREPGDSEEEVLERTLTVLAVLDLGVVLNAGESAFLALERGNGCTRRRCRHRETGRRLRHAVAVRHPDRLLAGEPGEQSTRLVHEQAGSAELTLTIVRHGPAEGLGHRLESVANAEHGHAEIEHAGVELRRPGLVHARRPAAQDDCRRLAAAHLVSADRMRNDL